MPPQHQAELLMERTINPLPGAIELIDQRVPGGTAAGRTKGSLAGLLNTAINANDLRVRAASLEIYLAAITCPKTAESVDTLLSRLDGEREHRAGCSGFLGVLGNRGVETARIESVFLDFIHNPDEQTRFYAVVGLGLVATDTAVAPLLETSAQILRRASAKEPHALSRSPACSRRVSACAPSLNS